MPLATLTIDINAKLANIERDMGKVAHLSEQSAHRIEKAWAAAGTAFAALGGGAVAGAIATFTRNAIDANAALDDMAEKTGATVESLSAISDIARIGGHDMGTLESGMVRLTKALAGGDDEAKAAGHALDQLGLKAADLRKMDTGTAMLEVAKSLDKFGDSGGKTALVIDLLGKNGAAMLPFLKDLAETGVLNAKVTAEQAAEAEHLQKSWNQLKVYSDDLGRSLASAVVPALNNVIKNFNQARAAGFGFFQSLTGIGVRGLTESVDDARAASGQRINDLRKEIDGLSAERDRQLRFGATASADSLQVAIDNATKKLRYYQALQRDVLAERFAGGQYLDARDLMASQKGDLSGYQHVTGGGKGGKTKVQEVIDALGSGTYLTRDKETAAAIKDSFDFENWAWGEIAKDREKAAQEANKYDEALKKAAQSLYKATDAGAFDAMLDSITQAEEAFARGFINQDQLDAITSNLMDVNDKLKETKSIGEELGLTFTSAFEDAIVGGKKFSEVLQGLLQDILRLVTRKTVTEPLANAVGSIDWGSLLKFNASGGVYSGAGISAYSGQVVSRPTVFPFASGIGLMGEAGPEAILPLKRSRDGRLGVEGGGGSMVVNIIEAPGRGGEREQRSEGGVNILDVFVERIKAGIAGDISDGRGPIPAALTSAYGMNRAAGAY